MDRIGLHQLDGSGALNGDRPVWNSTTGMWEPAAGAGSLTIQDENGTIATGVTQIDFQGAGVTATSGTGEVVVTVPGSGGTGSGGDLVSCVGVLGESDSGATSVSSRSISSTAVAVPVGSHIVVVVRGASGFHPSSVTDSAGNTYTQIAAPSAFTSATCTVYMAPVTTALGAGSTITATMTGSGATGLIAVGYTGLSGTVGSYSITDDAATANSRTGVGFPSTSGRRLALVVGAMAIAGPIYIIGNWRQRSTALSTQSVALGDREIAESCGLAYRLEAPSGTIGNADHGTVFLGVA